MLKPGHWRPNRDHKYGFRTPRLVLGAQIIAMLAAVAIPTSWSINRGPAAHAATLSSSYDSAVLADHPVAFWDVSSQGGTEPDLTGHGHTGTYVGGTPAPTAMMNGDQALDFNGSSEYLTVPSSPDFSIPTTKQLTWEAWIRPDVLQFPHLDSTQEYVDFMGKCQIYSPSCEWESRMYATSNSQNRPNRISAYVFNPTAGLGSAADWQPVTGLLQAGQWLHVVGEYQTITTPSQCNAAYPGTINIWVNGVQQDFAYHEPTGCMSQYPIVPTASNSPLDIGTMALDSWFEGAIGKVAIYNSLLTQSQIDAHFNAMTNATVSGSCYITCSIPVPTPSGWTTVPPTPTLGQTGTSTSTVLTGLQSYWTFDQGSGTTASDASGHGRTGTLYGNGIWSTAGKINGGLSLDGSSNYVTTTYPIPSSGPVTYSAWVQRVDKTSNYSILGSTNTTHTGPLVRIPSGSDDVKFWRQTCCTGTLFRGVLPATGTWFFVVLVDNPSSGKATLYVDGMSKGTNTYTASDSKGGALEVGAYQGRSGLFKGRVDEVGVWNRALTGTEIAALWNGGLGRAYPFG